MREGKEVVGEKGAVAAWPEEAARIGARIIDAGGNAMDAAAAASLACAVLSPDKNGIGGYVLAAVVLEGILRCRERMEAPDRTYPSPSASPRRRL